jgi:hypothetical protein
MIYLNKGGISFMADTRQKIIDYFKKADWPSTTVKVEIK